MGTENPTLGDGKTVKPICADAPVTARFSQHVSDPAMASSPAMQSMLATMELVKHEHLWFSVLGFGFAAAKLLADGGILRGRLGAMLWPLFAMALGVYMLGYTE
jgi:hypothetical protein